MKYPTIKRHNKNKNVYLMKKHGIEDKGSEFLSNEPQSQKGSTVKIPVYPWTRPLAAADVNCVMS